MTDALLLAAMDTADAPRRVRLSRKKGWRMPPNTVKVDRTTRWSNPFQGGQDGDGNRARLVSLFRAYLEDQPEGKKLAEAAAVELRGRNLACWCPLDGPCHADLLLEIARRS